MAWQILVLQISFFFLLLFALQKFFHGHLTGAISRMEKLQQKTIKKEEELQKYQEMVLKDCEERIRKTDEEIAQRKAQGEEELKLLKQSAAGRLEEEKAALKGELAQREKILERQFEQNARREGVDIACELVKGAFSESLLKVLHQHLSEELLQGLSGIPQAKGMVVEKSVKVRSAFPLGDAQKEKWKKELTALREKGAGSPVEIREEIDKDLLAGFVLVVGELVLDGSLKNRFEKNLK